ncbi:MAG: periplasmic heavy metal sensor [Desulfobacterales bacterium]|nr:periplasmic heavy metal sensor [Desulfobacterales bacterium]MCP4163460.1 periplasmic heavy metal sensor [Deltaproteobacteria bacterium]
MKTTLSKVLIVTAIVFVGAYAYAGWGNGHHRGWGNSNGYHMGGGGNYECPNFAGGNGRLSDAEYNKLKTLKENFYNDTKDIREDLNEKSAALSKEFNAENPDKGIIKSLQKEISALSAKFDQKAIEFKLEAKKINPTMGTGRGHRGRGPGNGTGCWR